MVEEEEEKKEKKKDIQKDTLNPVTKVNTKLDKELQEWEVDSTKERVRRRLNSAVPLRVFLSFLPINTRFLGLTACISSMSS